VTIRAAAAEFREVGVDSRNPPTAPINLLLILGQFAELVDITVRQFVDESHALFEQQCARLQRAIRQAGQFGGAEQCRQMTEMVRRYNAQQFGES
jgi:hypothetical protein